MNINRNVLAPAVYPALATTLLLLIPIIAMQFTDEVVWTLGMVLHILVINGFFITLFIISALLFRYAGSQQA